MRPRVLALVLTVATVCFTPGTGSGQQFSPVAVTPTVTPTVTQSASGLNAAKGATSFGSANTTLSGGDNPTAAVNVSVNVNLNTSWYNQPYTNMDGTAATNPCYGSSFALTQSYIQAHEMQHVAQIQADINTYFAQNPVTYDPKSGVWKFNGAATNAGAIQQRINDYVKSEVNAITNEDQAEYAAKDAGGAFGALESGARAASCTEFMNAVGNNLLALMRQAADTIEDINAHLKDAQTQANSATADAQKALSAAQDALAAAQKCDWEAFKKALQRYKTALAAALAALNRSQGWLDEANDADHAGKLSNLAAQYDAAKAAAGVTAFKAKLDPKKGDTGDSMRANIDKTLANLRAQTAAITAQNAATGAKLKRVKGIMDEAWAALLKCVKAGDPNFQTVQEAHQDYEGHGGYLPAPKATPTPSPTPAPTAKPIDKDASFTPVQPSAGDGAQPGQQAYVPPVAGPGSEIVTTFVDPQQSGPTDVVVGIVTAGGTSYYRTRTSSDGHVRFRLPLLAGAAAVTGYVLAKGFDSAGRLDGNAGEGAVTSDGPVPNTDALPNVPSRGAVIHSGSTAYDRAPGQGIVRVETSGTVPERTTLEVDGKTDGIVTRAVSNRSAVGELRSDVPLGRHTIDVNSGGVRSNAFQTDVVEIHPSPLPPSFVGQTVPLVVEVNGLGSDPATMTFAVGGGATLEDGSATKTVEVANGVARVGVRGTHQGQVLVRYHLHVTL